MVENEKFFDNPSEDPWGTTGNWDRIPSEDVDWSKVIFPEPMGVTVDFDLESALTGKQHCETVLYWIENCEVKKIFDLGSGKIYTRDSKGFFTIITAVSDREGQALEDYIKAGSQPLVGNFGKVRR